MNPKPHIPLSRSKLLSWRLACWVFCALAGCTRSIELPFPDPEPLLVVNALFSSTAPGKSI
ncbi:MAG: hypothetical protein D6730_19355 [Bacteroidetes bacterium]|nr:MAG: hypothetical protein D6730_19355 [Bacteroidota bacterium]